MPNPGKPAELKRKLGSKTYSPPKTDIQLVQPDEMPEPIRQLGHSGLSLWNRVWGQGKIWLSHRTDVELVQMVCEQLDERDELRMFVMGNIEAWHERAGLRSLEKEIASNLSSLGFTPADRTKLGLAEVKAQSKLEQLIAKRDG
jgi:hypothetical protein